jgi:hypothetical protein
LPPIVSVARLRGPPNTAYVPYSGVTSHSREPATTIVMGPLGRCVVLHANVSGVPAAYSVFEGASAPELRREQRLLTLFRTGKLLSGVGETICRVRNISPNGFMADACPAPAAGDRLALELWEGRSYDARVVWSQADRFGAQFLAPGSVSEMIGGPARGAPWHQRAPRFTPESGFVTLVHEGRQVRASIVNISQTGMAVFAYDLPLTAATRRDLRIEIDGLDPITGILCWSGNGAAGIQFDRPLSFETLSHWLWAASLATSPAPAGGPDQAPAPVRFCSLHSRGGRPAVPENQRLKDAGEA